MKKRKKIDKKIRRLKERLAKDARKLAKLTMQLGAVVTGRASAKNRKPRVRAAKGKAGKSSPSPRKASQRASGAAPKPVTADQLRPPMKKAKSRRKLNLSAERRAELSAAMKARWEAKKAADAGGNQLAAS